MGNIGLTLLLPVKHTHKKNYIESMPHSKFEGNSNHAQFPSPYCVNRTNQYEPLMFVSWVGVCVYTQCWRVDHHHSHGPLHSQRINEKRNDLGISLALHIYHLSLTFLLATLNPSGSAEQCLYKAVPSDILFLSFSFLSSFHPPSRCPIWLADLLFSFLLARFFMPYIHQVTQWYWLFYSVTYWQINSLERSPGL